MKPQNYTLYQGGAIIGHWLNVNKLNILFSINNAQFPPHFNGHQVVARHCKVYMVNTICKHENTYWDIHMW